MGLSVEVGKRGKLVLVACYNGQKQRPLYTVKEAQDCHNNVQTVDLAGDNSEQVHDKPMGTKDMKIERSAAAAEAK